MRGAEVEVVGCEGGVFVGEEGELRVTGGD